MFFFTTDDNTTTLLIRTKCCALQNVTVLSLGRQHGQVVRALDLKSVGCAFKSCSDC